LRRKDPLNFRKPPTANCRLRSEDSVVNASVIEMPGVGVVWRLEARRKDKGGRRPTQRRNWPRLRLVGGQFVICVEK